MSAQRRFRDMFLRYIPWWMTDRKPGAPASPGNVLYRVVWVMVSALDGAFDVLLQGIQAAWPGIGTPTALALTGRSRGIIRGQLESDDDYALRLRGWLDTWRKAGSAEASARAIHNYLGNRPRVRIVNRSGAWVTVNADGTLTRNQAAWNWDGTDYPERATHWWDIWIIVYPTQWAKNGTFGDGQVFGRETGLGHLCTPEENDAIRSEVSQWKSANAFVRAIIWTSDATLFDPTNPGSLPDGTWGSWSLRGSDPRVASGRNTTTCRYWET